MFLFIHTYINDTNIAWSSTNKLCQQKQALYRIISFKDKQTHTRNKKLYLLSNKLIFNKKALP